MLRALIIVCLFPFWSFTQVNQSIDPKISQLINYKTITAKNFIQLGWKSNNISLFIWDGSNEDNDIITIYYDDQPILENFVIKNKKTLIELPFADVDGAKLKFSAISTGSEGKNTVNIILLDDNVITPFVSVLDKNESIVINIQKKQN
jgi:hypothetical protein